jgi:Flp pilus assembly protein TadB
VLFPLPEIKDIIAIAAALIGASVATFNWRATRFRGKLKDDLEILKRYREELQAMGKTPIEVEADEHYKILSTKIHRKMIKAYALRGTDWSDAAIALLFFSLAFYAWNNEELFAPRLQAVFITALVVAGAIYAFLAVRDRNQPHQ